MNRNLKVGLIVGGVVLALGFCVGLPALAVVGLAFAWQVKTAPPPTPTAGGQAVDQVPANPMPLRTFNATLPKEPRTFTLMAELDSVYSMGYSDLKTEMYSVSLREPPNFQFVWGYVDKESESGKKLYERLRDGKKHYVKIELQHDPILSKGAADVFTIVRVLD